MSEREENRTWILRGAERNSSGWEQRIINAYGIEGALDMLSVQGGNPNAANLTRRPFARNEELKQAVRNAREAVFTMSRLAYETFWALDRSDSAGGSE